MGKVGLLHKNYILCTFFLLVLMCKLWFIVGYLHLSLCTLSEGVGLHGTGSEPKSKGYLYVSWVTVRSNPLILFDITSYNASDNTPPPLKKSSGISASHPPLTFLNWGDFTSRFQRPFEKFVLFLKWGAWGVETA